MANDKSTHGVSPESVSAINQLVPMDVTNQLCGNDNPKTLSVLILDASMSMIRFGDAPRQCVANHLAAIKKSPDGREQFCAVITFNKHATLVVPLARADAISDSFRYQNDYGTLLWKTVHEALKSFCLYFRLHSPKNTKIFVGVISDGIDNQSNKGGQPGNPVYPEKTKKWSKRALELGFELFAYGIGVDGKKLAEDLGFPTDDQHAFTLEASVRDLTRSTRHFSETTTGGFDPDFWEK
ncbi:MAG: vWA domain-containing protein [Patescibacteria group bacterium]